MDGHVEQNRIKAISSAQMLFLVKKKKQNKTNFYKICQIMPAPDLNHLNFPAFCSAFHFYLKSPLSSAS